MGSSRPIDVREIRRAEIDELSRITLTAYERLGVELGTYRPSLTDVAGRAAEAIVLVATDGERVLGGVTYVGDATNPYAEFADNDAAGIRMLAVAPDAQGLGVGTALVSACVARAVHDRRRRVVLHTTAAMTAAERLYRRLGFRRAPERDWRPQPHVALLGYELPVGDGATYVPWTHGISRSGSGGSTP